MERRGRERPRFAHDINESGICNWCGRMNTSDETYPNGVLFGQTCDQVPVERALGSWSDYIENLIDDKLDAAVQRIIDSRRDGGSA